MSSDAPGPPPSVGAARFLRFCLIGGISAAGSLALLYLLSDVLGLHYLVAFAITFVVANALAYVASRRFAFRGTAVGHGQGLLRYFLVAVGGLALNTVAMRGLVGGLGLWPVAAAAVLSVANAPLNFLLHRTLTFAVDGAAT